MNIVRDLLNNTNLLMLIVRVFILLVCFGLLIGIAQFSGAVLRRPNVSIYLSLILGLIAFQTDVSTKTRISSWRGEWI